MTEPIRTIEEIIEQYTRILGDVLKDDPKFDNMVVSLINDSWQAGRDEAFRDLLAESARSVFPPAERIMSDLIKSLRDKKPASK